MEARKERYSDFLLLLFVIIATQYTITKPYDYFKEIHAKSISKEQIHLIKNYVLVDVRHPIIYKKNHIEGAINLPFSKRFDIQLDINIKKLFDLYPNSKTSFIFYCDNKICNLAKILTEYVLKKYPHINASYLKGGIELWENTRNLAY